MTSSELHADIERTREELGAALNVFASRIDLKAQIRQHVATLKQGIIDDRQRLAVVGAVLIAAGLLYRRRHSHPAAGGGADGSLWVMSTNVPVLGTGQLPRLSHG